MSRKIYVSSTYTDLVEHRAAVIDTLTRRGFDVGCMEKYPAFEERPADKCLADVAACDCYVLVLAWRYGFEPPRDNPEGRSITHLEYEEAIRCKRRCLVFLLDENAAWKKPHIDKDDTKISAFRAQVGNEHGVRFFTSADNLAKAVHEAVGEVPRDDGRPDDNAAIRAAYLDWLRGDCARVVRLGLDLKDSQNLRLGQVYVPALTAAKAV